MNIYQDTSLLYRVWLGNGRLHAILPASDFFRTAISPCLENTHNRGGGRVQPYDTIDPLCGWARQNGLRTHLDGARLWNAVVASGILAAAALHALEHHVDRLLDDHRNARRLADGIRQIDGLRLEGDTIDTNIVVFHLQTERKFAQNLVHCLREQGVLMLAFGPSKIRAVTHLDVTRADVDQALEILTRAVAGLS